LCLSVLIDSQGQRPPRPFRRSTGATPSSDDTLNVSREGRISERDFSSATHTLIFDYDIIIILLLLLLLLGYYTGFKAVGDLQ
jgi:hypothetical protein